MKILKRDMNDNELMRGNLVYADGEVCRIQSIGHGEWVGVWNFSKEDTDNLLLHELSPIPITEELLLKNGFTYREDSYCARDLHIYTKKIYGQFMIECTEGFSGDGQYLSNVYELERREERAHTWGNVKHLHQLQNLCNIAGVEIEWKV